MYIMLYVKLYRGNKHWCRLINHTLDPFVVFNCVSFTNAQNVGAQCKHEGRPAGGARRTRRRRRPSSSWNTNHHWITSQSVTSLRTARGADAPGRGLRPPRRRPRYARLRTRPSAGVGVEAGGGRWRPPTLRAVNSSICVSRGASP